jgi:restriction endonuclease S subunit
MVVILGELFEIRTGYTFRDSIAELERGGVAVIQAGDINAARQSGLPRIDFNGTRHLLQVGDILLSARGATVARTVSPDLLPAVASSSVLILRPKSPDINSRFMTRYLNSHAGQAVLSKIMSGAYIKTIRKSELQELLVPMPPLKTQQKLVELGATVDDYREMLREKDVLLAHIYDRAMKLGG